MVFAFETIPLPPFVIVISGLIFQFFSFPILNNPVNLFVLLRFVTYLSASSAEAAVAQLNNHEVEGRRLRVQMDDDSGGNRGGNSGFGGGSCFGGGQSSDAKGNQVKVLSCPTSIAEVFILSIKFFSAVLLCFQCSGHSTFIFFL